LLWWLTGYGHLSVDLVGVDSLLGFTPIALGFLQMFAVARGLRISLNVNR